MKWVFHRWKAALAVILCLTNCSWSESPTEPERATVRGIVSAAGVPVPGARVTVMIRLPLQRIENYETFANAQGEYEFVRIEPGLCDFMTYCPVATSLLAAQPLWAIKPGLNQLDLSGRFPCS